MDRHLDANGSASQPSTPSNSMGANVYPQGGASPSLPGPWWFHMVTEELRAVIAAAGLTPDRGDLNQLVDAINALVAAGIPAGGGKQTVWIPAGAMTPRTTSGAATGSIETATNKIMVKSLDFDAAVAEYAQFAVQMPKSWNEGTVSALFVWSNASGTGSAVWAIQAVAISDDDVLDAAFGSAQSVTDAVTAAGDLMRSAETSALTVGGTPLESDVVIYQIYRDAANGADTLAVDARLHGVALFYTTTNNTDA